MARRVFSKLVSSSRMSVSRYLRVSLLAICLLVAFIVFYRPNIEPKTKHMSNLSEKKNTFKLEFIPRHPVISCNDLFTDKPINAFKMSTTFDLMYKEFRSEVNASVGGETGPVAGYFDGHSFLLPEQYKALHYMASLKFVRTACETGFNYGHSSFNYLTANDKVVVHSFDSGWHQYTKYMADYLIAKFPGRFFMHYGDSRKSMPEFFQNNPDIRCDFMFVDSSHTYEVAKPELENFMKVAGDENIIAMDDYPVTYGGAYGNAWEELVSNGEIQEIMRCKFVEIIHKHTPEAGFVLGSVVSRPPNKFSAAQSN